MPNVTLSSGKAFNAHDNETLLDAGLRAGVALAYSCRTGRCSSCRSYVTSGTTRALHAEMGLTAAQRDAGWVLGCVRVAESDVVLEVEDLGDIHLPGARTLPCRIQSLEAMSPNVLRVILRLPPTTDFNFVPGQYVDVIGSAGVRRSYSIANAPAADKRIELHVRQVPGGAMSAYWFGQARANDLLRLYGPLGTFFPRDVVGRDLVFMATGTGIAPVKAIIEGVAQWPASQRPRSVAVYWGGRRPEDLYWTPVAPGLAFRFVPVLSRADDGWAGARGHVQQALLADSPDWSLTTVYACGSDLMIQDAHARLVAAGLPYRRFASDAFVCSAAV